MKPPGDGFATATGTALKLGASGPKVDALQALMVRVGLMTAADVAADAGTFGAATDKAVRDFQASKGLAVDGIAGEGTRKAIGLLPEKPVVVLPPPADPALHPGTDLTDPLGEPLPMKDLAGAPDGKYVLMHTSGPLFGASGPQPSDIHQGQAGDCYLLSTLGAIAAVHPELIKDLIHQNDDGTFTVTLKSADATGTGKPVTVAVDDEVYVSTQRNATTGTLYGENAVYAQGDANGYHPGAATYPQGSTWVSLVEKAMAKTTGGSFEGIGRGGWPHDTMARILGRPSVTFHTGSLKPEEVWAKVSAAMAAKEPTAASTFTDGASAERYTNTGIVHGHAYAVLGTAEHDGEKFIQLRNPWGNTEPAGDGKNDGIFELKLSEFVKYYDVVDSSPENHL